MVGVPGRSKACLTCRKRKKGVSDPPFGQIQAPFVLELLRNAMKLMAKPYLVRLSTPVMHTVYQSRHSVRRL